MGVCLVLLCPLACASKSQPQALSATRDRLAELDEFGALLVKAGLATEFLPTGVELSPEQAQQLRLHFDLNPPTSTAYAPWLVADVLLLDVTLKKQPVSRAELGHRIQEFQPLFVLRRDGYLAEALSGRPNQCVGPVEVRDGGLRAGAFEVGNFYRLDDANQWQHVQVPAPAPAAR
ncbi:hypothetical protein KYC5002_45955 [Archangium violaceum]|uniref:hypothetical protein n=1 Tax=Archangium violaceum TaxID=83451 RepID=UPI002B2D04BC|nr:hypothetical protein KYC5002_45955 [Archangium gephyra]